MLQFGLRRRPHLHFGVQWQGLYMEPATLLRLRFPV